MRKSIFFLPCARRCVRVMSLGSLLLILALAGGDAWSKAATTPAPGKTATAEKKKDESKPKNLAKEKAKEEKKRKEKVPFAEGHPLMLLEGVRCQVHHEGQVRQDMWATSGRYDEKADVMELNKLRVRFKDERGTSTLGEIQCGTGRVWTKDQPESGIASHDMVMQKNVTLATRERLILRSPEMKYRAAESILHTDKGFLEQIPLNQGYMIGRGQSFDIKLLREQNKFESLKQYGSPAELRKSEKPVLNP